MLIEYPNQKLLVLYSYANFVCYAWACVCHSVCMCSSGYKFHQSVLPISHVDHRDRTQVLRLHSKSLYSLSHLS